MSLVQWRICAYIDCVVKSYTVESGLFVTQGGQKKSDEYAGWRIKNKPVTNKPDSTVIAKSIHEYDLDHFEDQGQVENYGGTIEFQQNISLVMISCILFRSIASSLWSTTEEHDEVVTAFLPGYHGWYLSRISVICTLILLRVQSTPVIVWYHM